MRYHFLLEIPLSTEGIKGRNFSFVVNDEVHINFGRQIIYNYFDQNRFFIGLKYQTNIHDNLQVGYMNLFQQLPAGNKYKNNHVIRVSFFQNFDFRKKMAK